MFPSQQQPACVKCKSPLIGDFARVVISAHIIWVHSGSGHKFGFNIANWIGTKMIVMRNNASSSLGRAPNSTGSSKQQRRASNDVSAWFNLCLSKRTTINLNKIFIYCYISFFNLPLLSESTKEIHAYYKKSNAPRGRGYMQRPFDETFDHELYSTRTKATLLAELNPALAKSGPYRAGQARNKRSTINLGQLLDFGHDLGLSESERAQWLDKAELEGDSFKIPTKNPFIQIIFFMFGVFLAFRCYYCIIALNSETTRHQLALTSTAKLPITNNMLSCSSALGHRANDEPLITHRSQPLPSAVGVASVDNRLNGWHKDIDPAFDATCRLDANSVRKFYENTFKGVCIWNFSMRLELSEQIERLLLFELSDTMQILRQETRTIDFIGGTMLLSGSLVMPIVLIWSSFDIPALMYVYMPKFVAHRIHQQLNEYLNLLRFSYMNFWSIYTISSTGHLAFIQGLEPANQSWSKHRDETNMISGNISNSNSTSLLHRNNQFSPIDQLNTWPSNKPIAVNNPLAEALDSVHLNYNQYASYIQESRGKYWRSILLNLHSIMWFFLCIIFIFLFSTVTIHYIFNINGLAESNLELYQLIESPEKSSLNFAPISSKCLINWTNQSIVYERFKILFNDCVIRSLVSTESGVQAAASSSLSSSQNGTKFKKSYYLGQGILTQDNMLLSHTIKPRSQNSLYSIVFPLISLLAISAYAAAYLVVYLITFIDLSFWLNELCMKLTICTIIMRHYQGKTSYQDIDHRLVESYHPWAHFVRPSLRQQARSNLKAQDDGESSILSSVSSKQSLGFDGEDNSVFRLQCTDVLRYIIANRSQREDICERCARRVLKHDLMGAISPRHASRNFLISTYLDFRLFQDEIDLNRTIVKFIMATVLFHCFNVTGMACTLPESPIKYSLICGAMILSNSIIFTASAFRSSCFRLNGHIYSMLASSLGGDRLTRYMLLIWRKCLIDLSGSRSKFSFRFISIAVTYATALQVRVGLVCAIH